MREGAESGAANADAHKRSKKRDADSCLVGVGPRFVLLCAARLSMYGASHNARVQERCRSRCTHGKHTPISISQNAVG